MKVFKSVHDWLQFRKGLAEPLGFVPTMGALHKGHLSLISKSQEQNKKTLVSIFVNPTQFNDSKDLENYPRPENQDLSLLEKMGVDFVLLPSHKEIYQDDFRFKITESSYSHTLCGAHRPGHFDGVMTVVMKLLNIARCDRAYFGEKDYQQLQLIKDLVQSFFMTVEIIAVPTVREVDGLALSSRNVLLSEENRQLAPQLYKIISTSKSAEEAKGQLLQLGFKVDYVEDIGSHRMSAVQLENVRLIDNVSL